MKILVKEHELQLEKEKKVNQNEYNITKCEFEFSEEYTNDLVKVALFTNSAGTYKQYIINNECYIPVEILEKKESIVLGVYAYKEENDELVLRYSPEPIKFYITEGSYKKDAINTEPVTASDKEQMEQALTIGLNEINDKIEEVNNAITETNNLDLDVDKVGKVATVTLTKKDATEKVVTLSDGTNLMFNWQGTSLGIKTDEDDDYTYVDLQGVQGETGPMGAPFTIKKTYSSVAEMNADFNNMNVGDYVMIASTVEIEDNAKLYTKGETQWIFITDFSGATGIQGETGLTPNIQIGTVVSGDSPSVTRSGTNENPVLNFTLVKGDTGATGQTGATGATGNGIDHISLTNTSGAVKTYTIYYTNGDTTTFNVTDGEVTQEVFDEEVERAKMVYNALPKVSGEGTDLTLNNTAECPVYDVELSPSALEQATTTGKNLLNPSILQNGNIDTGTGAPSGTVNAYVRTNDYISVTSSQDYSFQYQLKITGITGQIVVYEYDTNKGYIKFDVISAYSGTVTLSATTKYIKLRLQTGTTQMQAYDYGQAEQSSTVTTYEQYTGGQPSPNPSYPQTVHTISGNNNVKVVNKNLFDGELELGTISGTDGTNKTNDNYIRCKNYIPVEELTDYKFSTDNSSLTRLYVYEYKEDFSYNLTANKSIGLNTHLTTEQGTKYIRFRPNIQITDTTIKFQVEKGTTATSYTPHQEQNFPISLGDLEYCKIGDYEDIFFKNVVGSEYYDSTLESGKWYLKKNVEKNILTSFSGSVSSNIAYFGLSSRARTISNSQVIYCDKLNFGGNYTSLDNAIAGMSANQISHSYP